MKKLLQNWNAPYVARQQRILDQFSGGILNVKTLANADAAGYGPADKFKVGRKVFYSTASLIQWLEARLEE